MALPLPEFLQAGQAVQPPRRCPCRRMDHSPTPQLQHSPGPRSDERSGSPLSGPGPAQGPPPGNQTMCSWPVQAWGSEEGQLHSLAPHHHLRHEGASGADPPRRPGVLNWHRERSGRSPKWPGCGQTPTPTGVAVFSQERDWPLDICLCEARRGLTLRMTAIPQVRRGGGEALSSLLKLGCAGSWQGGAPPRAVTSTSPAAGLCV